LGRRRKFSNALQLHQMNSNEDNRDGHGVSSHVDQVSSSAKTRNWKRTNTGTLKNIENFYHSLKQGEYLSYTEFMEKQALISLPSTSDNNNSKLSSKRSVGDLSSEKFQAAQNAVRKRVALEIVQTEQNYLRSLSVVIPLIEEVISKQILSKEELDQVFSNLKEIFESHQPFLKMLNERFSSWKDTTTIGDIFLNMDFIKLYRLYIHNYNMSFAATFYLTKSYVAFEKVIQKFEEEQKKSTRLNLDSFLIMPVQRVPRYILLLKDMLKYTQPSHPDWPMLQQALDKIQSTLSDINATINKESMEHARKMMEINNRIDGTFEILVHPKRRFVYEGTLIGFPNNDPSQTTKFRSSTIKNFLKKEEFPEASYYFLFNDLWVCCYPKKHSETEKLFDYAFTIYIKDIDSINDVPVKTERSELAFIVNMKSKASWTFYAKTSEEKHAWMNSLILLIVKLEKERLVQMAHNQ